MATSTGNSFIGSGAGGTRKSSSETAVPVTSISANVPLANVGAVVPYVIGRRRVASPNVLWYGNLQAIYETKTETKTRTYVKPGYYNGPFDSAPPEDVTETITTTTRTPIGFLTDILMGVCLGPGVVLRGIFVDGEEIWSGNVGPARATFTIGDNETAFRNCEVAFAGGAVDQDVDPWISTPDFPGHVGIAYIMIRGMRADIRLGAISFEVERFPNPLGLTSGQNRLDDDINCATAIYDLLTSKWGGAGLDTSDVELASLQAAALTYAAEANYCAIIVDRETTATAVIGALQDQTYSIIYQNPRTGKIEIKAIREGQVSLGSAKAFGRSNIIALQNFNKSAWSDTFEIIHGIYVERANNYEPTPILVQNVGNVSQTGRAKRSTKIEYPYSTKDDLTLFLASRDLALVSVPTFSFSIVTNRDGADVLPGQVIRVTWPDYGIYSLPVVVKRARKNPLRENTVLLTVVQYIFPDRSPVFDLPGLPFDPGVSYGPVSPPGAAFITAPFWIAERAGLVSINTANNVVYPLILPIPANNIQMTFSAFINNVPGIGRTSVLTQGNYATYGKLSSSVGKYDGFEDGELASITINGVINPVNLVTFTETQQREGKALIFIGNEILTFADAVEVGPNQWQLNGVKRALMDTVAQAHAADADVFIVGNFISSIVPTGFNHPVGYTPEWRLVSSTVNQNGRFEDAFASTAWNTGLARTMRSPRPHDTRIDGVRPTTEKTVAIGQSYTVSWKTRLRSGPTIKFQTDAAENSELLPDNTVQFHRVYLRDAGSTLRLIGTTPTDETYNSLVVTIPANAAIGSGTLFVRSVNQFGESVYDDTLPVYVYGGSPVVFDYEIET